MDTVVLLATAILALILLTERKGGDMPDPISQTAIGAAVGSILSAWWRKAIRWQVNLAVGFFAGWWGGDYAIELLALGDSVATGRAIGSGLALIGYSLMDGVMRVPWGSLVGKVFDKASARLGGAKE